MVTDMAAAERMVERLQAVTVGRRRGLCSGKRPAPG